MTLPDSATLIYCQTCGNSWEKADTTPQYYFASATTHTIGAMTTPAAIVALAETMTFCPKCDVGRLAKLSEAMGSGDAAEDKRTDPDGLDKESAGSGGADVTHTGRNTRV